MFQQTTNIFDFDKTTKIKMPPTFQVIKFNVFAYVYNILSLYNFTLA